MPINLLEKRKKHKNDVQGDQYTEDQDGYGNDYITATTSDTGDDNSNYGNDTTWADNATDDSYSDQETTNSAYDNNDTNYGNETTDDNNEDRNTSKTTANPYGFATTTEVAESVSTTPLEIESYTTEVAYTTTTTPVEITYTTATTLDAIYTATTTPTTSDAIYATPTTADAMSSITSILLAETTTLLEPTSTLITDSLSFTLSSLTATSANIPNSPATLLMPTSTSNRPSTTENITSFFSSFVPIATASSILDQGKQGDTISHNDGLSQKSKAIIGGCVGGIGGAIVLGTITFWCITRWKRQRREIDMESYRPESDYASGLSEKSQLPHSHEPYYEHKSSSNSNTSTPDMSDVQMIQNRY